MEPREEGIDRLLRRSMAGPLPSLQPDFDQRVLREIRRRAQPLDRYGRMLLAGYGLVAAVVSAVVMRSQGLDWGTTAGMILAPLLVVGLWGRRATARVR